MEILIQFNSANPIANPSFYKVDTTIMANPGLYIFTDFQQQTEEQFTWVDTIRSRFASDYFIHDIAEIACTDVLARFPKAQQTLLTFYSTKSLWPQEFKSASCSARVFPSASDRVNSYEINTEWHVPIPLAPGRWLSILLSTKERIDSSVHEYRLKQGFPATLDQVHPTYGVHEMVARSAGSLRYDRAEVEAVKLSRLAFELADAQSPCRRLTHVTISLRESFHMEGKICFRRKSKELYLRGTPVSSKKLCMGCLVVYNRADYEQSSLNLTHNHVHTGWHRAYLALGSNIGDRIKVIELACRAMMNRGIKVTRTSALYETKAMYLEDQQPFINGACEVSEIGHQVYIIGQC